MKKLILSVAAIAMAMSSATPVFAAADGTLSETTSVGTVDFTTVIPNMVRISGMTDMTLTITAAALNNQYFSRQDAETQFCVYSNVGLAGGYTVTVDGAAGTTAPFRLRDVAGANVRSAKLDYSVWISDDIRNSFAGGAAANGYTFPGVQKTGYQTTRGGKARPTTTDCSDVGNNAALHVGVTNAEILAATAGTYKGTLTVTVSTI